MRRVLVVSATLAIGAMLVGPLACRQIVGIGSGPETELTTSVCGLPYGSNACASCVNASCCAESTACARDPLCSAYERCMGACNGDPKCRSQCTGEHPGVTSRDVSALSACLASKCDTACGIPCGGVAGYVSEPASADACQSCIEGSDSVCADARAWATSVEGDAYWRCVLACQTEDCRLTCGTDNPAGASAQAPFQKMDYAGTCSSACMYGGYWACVGKVTWPVARSTTWRDSFEIDDYFGNPATNVDLSICLGCPCGMPDAVLQQGRTDDAGTVTWTVPQQTGALGLGPGVGLMGCAQLTSPTYVPTFAYWGWPISEPVTDRRGTLFKISVIEPATLASLASMIGVTQATDRGWIAGAVFDCLGSPAPGVRVTTTSDGSGAGMDTYYFQDVGSEVEGTAKGGAVVIFNVPPGLHTLNATPNALGKRSSQVSVNVATGTQTGLYMLPTQNP